MYVIGKTKKGKLIKFNNSIDCYNGLKENRIYQWRQIEADNIAEAFKKYDN